MSPALDHEGRNRAANFACIGFALGLAWWLKDFYSRAHFQELLWILAPTRRLVEYMTGAAFETEMNHGFLSRDRLYQIVPACAGVNFMIIAFCSLSCGLVHALTSLRARLVLIVASAVAAYAATVLANSTRIALAMWLHAAGTTSGVLTADRLHCVTGVAVYFLFLCVLFAVAARLTGAQRDFA